MDNAASQRLVGGLVFTSVSALVLAANAYWFWTRDDPRARFHLVMRDGWRGFWITTVTFSVLLLIGVGLLLLERRARRARVGHQSS